MSAPPGDGGAGCITCADVGIPMRVLELADATAVCVDQDGRRHEVAIDLIESVNREEWLLVHAGVAIAANPPGRVGARPPGRVGARPPGRVGARPPGRVGARPPGRVGARQ